MNKFIYFLCFPWLFIGKFILSINNEHAQDHSCPGEILLMHKSYLVGYPVLYNGPDNLPLKVVPGQQKLMCEQLQASDCTEAKLTPGSVAVPLAKLFLCQPLNSLSVHPLGDLFLCHPSFGWVIFCADNSILHHLASYFRGDHLTVNPSIPFEWFVFMPLISWASYLLADHVPLHPFIPWERYFRAYHLIFDPLASYFCAGHVTLHQSTGFSLGRLHIWGGADKCRGQSVNGERTHEGGIDLMGGTFDKFYHKLKVLLLLRCNYTMRFIGCDSIQTRWFISYRFQIHTVT